MSLLHYFQRRSSLPTPQQTGIGEQATAEANAAVAEVIAVSSSTKKRKYYTSFTTKTGQRLAGMLLRQYASALKKFKGTFPDLGESSVCLFKRKYLEAIKQRKAQGDSSCVTSIPSKRMGRPLTLGDLDTRVQQYRRTPLIRAAWDQVVSVILKMPATLKRVFYHCNDFQLLF